jgi:HEAT repeat protein
MRKTEPGIAALTIIAGIFLLCGFGARRTDSPHPGSLTGVSRYVAVLKSGSAQQKAEAAYWLGKQRASAVEAITSLAAVLGDTTQIDPTQYRLAARDEKPRLGEEAAVALAQIGRPAIDPLIRVLKTSPNAEARKNAAWALGAIHDTSITGSAA